MNILVVDRDREVIDELGPLMKLESIVMIFSDSKEKAKSVLHSSDISLLLISSFVDGIVDVVMESKSQDLFRPIISIDSNPSVKYELLTMGTNSFYHGKIDIVELSIQLLNLLTLYQAKKNSKNQNDVLKTLTLALEARDPYTFGHGERVAIYAVTLYDALGFRDYEERDILRSGCLIHDVGKIGIPDNILKSSWALTDDEYEVMQKHPTLGVNICFYIISDDRILNIIEQHHEKLDGSGYPYGLKGDEIDKLVQISTIADLYDALTSDRSYRIKNTQEEAISIIEEQFVNNGKINNEYYDMFKSLLLKNIFMNIKSV